MSSYFDGGIDITGDWVPGSHASFTSDYYDAGTRLSASFEECGGTAGCPPVESRDCDLGHGAYDQAGGNLAFNFWIGTCS